MSLSVKINSSIQRAIVAIISEREKIVSATWIWKRSCKVLQLRHYQIFRFTLAPKAKTPHPLGARTNALDADAKRVKKVRRRSGGREDFGLEVGFRSSAGAGLRNRKSKVGLDHASEPRFIPRLNSVPAGLKQLAAVEHGVIRTDQHDRAGRIGKAEDQDFGHQRPDLLGREIDHRGNLPAEQRVSPVMLSELC
jgi:hypothetical protein